MNQFLAFLGWSVVLITLGVGVGTLRVPVTISTTTPTNLAFEIYAGDESRNEILRVNKDGEIVSLFYGYEREIIEQLIDKMSSCLNEEF